MLVEFGKANLLDKARQQPDKVRAVLDKLRTDGLIPTIDSVRNKLEWPISMGYCNVGVVAALGPGVTGLQVGDRVASNGVHAEMVCVPKNLCAKVPDTVSDEAAAFTVLGAIALQGIRLSGPALGEAIAVVGLGLIGLIAVQLLRASGCRVLGIDLDPQRLSYARDFGAETVDLSRGDDAIDAAARFSRGRGVDAVLITASTASNEPVHQAATICRKRGRIVLVGVVGLELSRADFYEKELSFQVSCSYGPGRYDPSYEADGNDYPIGFVRWTEQRNFEAVLDMLAEGRIDVGRLVTHRFPVDRAPCAYELISSAERALGILLQYRVEQPVTSSTSAARTVEIIETPARPEKRADPVIGFIGSGNYARQVLMPSFKATGVELKWVASKAGVTAVTAGRKFGFAKSTTDTSELLGDREVDIVVIATRHDSHAMYVCEAVRTGRHVFVEKPLAITEQQLAAIESVIGEAAARDRLPILMVGFNRRFAPHTQRIRQLLDAVPHPKTFVMTINAGSIPSTHWVHDPEAGGGRIIGEACHFIDLLRYLAAAPITRIEALAPAIDGCRDSLSLQLGFQDGSLGALHYLTNGHRSFPKERLDVFCAGRVLELDNFRTLLGFGWPGFSRMRLWRQDKGNRACVAAFVEAVRQRRAAPIPFSEIVEVTRATFEVVDQLKSKRLS